MPTNEVSTTVTDGVATVTIERPERRNAMNFAVMAGLRDALTALRTDESARVVVVTGAGDKAFCAGADLGGIADNASPAEVHEARGALADVFRNFDRLGKPSIARVRGYALAGGFGLACACDIVVAADDAVFGTPEVDIGLWPYMITVPLLRSMPQKVALELMMTGRRVGAAEALSMGFVNRVVAAADLDATVTEYCDIFLAKSPLVLRRGRDSFYRTLDMGNSDDALAYLHSMLSLHTTTNDAAEGIAAFAEKRQPRWTNS